MKFMALDAKWNSLILTNILPPPKKQLKVSIETKTKQNLKNIGHFGSLVIARVNSVRLRNIDLIHANISWP